MLIQSIDCDNIEKFFIVFPHKKDFFLNEMNFKLIRKKDCTDEVSWLIYLEDEFSFTEAMFEIIEDLISTYQKKDKRKSKFLQECIINQKNWKEARASLKIERRTYFAWRKEILEDAILFAVGQGILKIN